MPFRELSGNLKQGDSSTHLSFSGDIVVDAATQKVYVHDGVTPGGSELGGTRLIASVGEGTESGGDFVVSGGNSDGSAGQGGNLFLGGGSVVGDSTDKGGDVTLLGGGASFGTGGNIMIAGGDPGGLIFLYSLPTEDPHVASAVWNSSGTLMISAG